MNVWQKLTGATEAPAGRAAKERKRRAKEIHAIDTRTTAWLRSGGWIRTGGS